MLCYKEKVKMQNVSRSQKKKSKKMIFSLSIVRAWNIKQLDKINVQLSKERSELKDKTI